MYGQMPFMMPNTSLAGNALKTSLLSKINWSSLLSNTQKVLNVANQAIPLYYQVKPVMKNIRSLSKIGKEFNKINNMNSNVNTNQNQYNNLNEVQNNIPNNNYNGPTPNFFL